MSFFYIKENYKVPAEIGRKVRFEGKKEGVIVKPIGGYIGVVFDGDKATNVKPLHPTWEVEYLGMGKLPKMTKGQQRYQEYLHSEYNGTFMEWLKLG